MDDRVGELVALAKRLAVQQDFGSEAEQINRDLVELMPLDIPARNRLAQCLVARGARLEAVAVCESVLQIDPGNGIASGRLAVLRRADTPPPPPAHPRPRRTRATRTPWRPRTIEVDITEPDAARFAQQMNKPEYANHERNYKVALHIVISALFSADHVDPDRLPAHLANVFGSNPDLDNLGLTKAELRQVRHGLQNNGLRGAFTNLCEGRWGYPQFTWIPEAVAKGFGAATADTFRALVDASQPLVKRIDDFRVDLTDIATQSEPQGVVVQSKDFRISLAFAALILGGYDPHAYSFYHAGAMRNAFERYAPRFAWPARSCSRGEVYVDVCTFVASIDLALRTHGVPVQDFIDTQSFIWLRFCWGDNEPWSTTRKPVRRRRGPLAIGEDQREG